MKARGFSLLEVLVALAVLAVLGGAVFGFAFDLVSRREAIRVRADRDAAAAVLIDRVERALFTCVAAGAAGRAGVLGGASSVEVTSDRVDAGGEARPGLSTMAVGLDAGAVTVDGEPVLSGVRRLRLRYRDAGAWVESFDSAALSRLPAAVEVSIWFGDAAESAESAESADAVVPGDVDRAEDVPAGLPDVYRVMAVPDGGGDE